MNRLTSEKRAKAIILFLILLILAQIIGLAPGLIYLTGSFPTYFHKIESIALVTILFSSLLIVAFNKIFVRKKAILVIGALIFFSFCRWN